MYWSTLRTRSPSTANASTCEDPQAVERVASPASSPGA